MKQEISVELAGGKRLSFETGNLAKQAHGAAVVRMGDNVVLATGVANAEPREGIDFFPLTVDYREYTYAGGRIPGGFIKREGRPSEREILTSRQIDRPIRPLFPDGFRCETQVIAFVLSADTENDPDVAAINGASCALTISDIPFQGPIGAVRVGLVNGGFVVNPTYSEMRDSLLNIMVVGTAEGIVMIESGAKEVKEETVVDAIEFAHTEIKKICGAINELRDKAGKPKRQVEPPEFDQAYYNDLKSRIGTDLAGRLDTEKHPKSESYALVKELKKVLIAALPEEDEAAQDKLKNYYEILPERAISTVLPTEDKWPYAMRVVSDILESNGSSSMATVCGAALSLMDAGVPLKAPVAGVAMGLVKEGEQYAILTDIAGAEDHYGDMDFKVAGTRDGITALQMDIKVSGITAQIMREALAQAQRGRMFILEKMEEVLSSHREKVSAYAPRIYTLQIPVDRIRDVIGPGGKMIRSIIEQTGVKIDVEDTGKVNVASNDEASANKALQIIRDLTATAEVGKTYLGKVSRLADFGAFVEILPGTDGLLHISEVAEHRMKDGRDELKEGDQVLVKVLAVEGNRIRLARKAVLKEQRAQVGGGSVESGGEVHDEAAVAQVPPITIEGGGDFPDEEPNFNREGAPHGAADRGGDRGRGGRPGGGGRHRRGRNGRGGGHHHGGGHGGHGGRR